MQISVTVANNKDRKTIWAEDTDTLKSAFEKAQVSRDRGMLQLNGVTLDDSDINKTFAQCGVTGRTCTLSIAVKSVGN